MLTSKEQALLTQAGLNMHLTEIIGHLYKFTSDDRWTPTVIGTVAGLEIYADDNLLNILVSNCRISGKDNILSIQWSDNTWKVIFANEKPTVKGIFQLI